VLTPQGLVLVEIKSRPGAVEGDAHSWTWNTDGRRTTVDNPLRLANRKAQRLALLLRRQEAIAKSPVQAPWVEAAVFLSAVRSPLRLDASTRNCVFLRGRPVREPPATLAPLPRHDSPARHDHELLLSRRYVRRLTGHGTSN
jgi:hypothetical protein